MPAHRFVLVTLALVGCNGSASTPTSTDGAIADAGTSLPYDADLCSGEIRPSTNPACGAALCGNGVIDECSCHQRWYGSGRDAGGTYVVRGAELCDPAAPLAATCESLGFTGGSLACGPDCTFDARGCGQCSDDPAIIQCSLADGVTGSTVDAAASLTELAVVTTTDVDIQLARFDFDLLPLGSSSTPAPGTLLQMYAPSVAATDSGWLVTATRASADGTEVVLAQFDASGAPVGSVRVLDGGSREAHLADGGSGGTWAAWAHDDAEGAQHGVRVAALATDGTPRWTRSVPLVSAGSPHIVATTAGAVLAVTARDGVGDEVVHFFSIDTAGTVTTMPLGPLAVRVSVSWEGTFGLVRYDDGGSAGSIRLGVIDERGNIVAAPQVTAGAEVGEVAGPYLIEPTATSDGFDLAITRRSSTGATVGPLVFLMTVPTSFAYSVAAVARGSDAFVAWVGGSGTVVAHLTL